MNDAGLLLITGRQVEAVLENRHEAVVELVAAAYRAHARREDALPTASILRFPERPTDRIIALPARVGPDVPVAGVKWISSFPANTGAGLERASAVILVNTMRTGRVTAVMEGSLISAQRTAASAALAARTLHRARGPSTLGLVGCGRINVEILRFLRAAGPPIDSVLAHDRDPDRVTAFVERCAAAMPETPVTRVDRLADVLADCPLVSFATTATTPYVTDLSMCPPGATVLHVSLRDIAPSAILQADNVVDDVEHVCAARTSVHLAEQLTGHRDFVRTTLGDILVRRSTARADEMRPLVFSPFGLGTLDIALAAMVLETAGNDAIAVPDFWPVPWHLAPTGDGDVRDG